MSSNGSDSTTRALEELRRLNAEVETTTAFEDLRPLFYRMTEIARQYPAIGEIQSLAARIRQRIAERGRALKEAAPASPPAGPPEALPKTPPVEPPTGRPEAPADDLWQPEPRSAEASGASTTQQAAVVAPELFETPSARAPSKHTLYAAIAAAAAFIVVLGSLWLFLWREGAPGTFSIEFQSSPPGAALRIDRELRGVTNTAVDLAPGSYKLELILEGYQPAISTITVSEASPRTVSFTLMPRPQTVRVFADFRSGDVLLDGEVEGELEDGQCVLDSVPTGQHTLTVLSGRNRAGFSIEISPAQAPRLLGPIEAHNVLAVVIGSAKGEGQAHSSARLNLALDGQPVGAVGPEGLRLTGVRPGEHEIRLGEGPRARTLVAGFGVSPALTAFLKLDVNAGTLVVVTSEDDATVVLNGREQRRRTANGQLRIPLLPARQYRVGVFKQGYERPAEQLVSIRKGQEKSVRFMLQPLPQQAALRISGALPGAEVLLDARTLGKVAEDGVFSALAIQPGGHTIMLRKQPYRAVSLRKQFRPGETTELAGEDVAMERAQGSVRLRLAPANAKTTYRSVDSDREATVFGREIQLPEGSYIFSARAPGYASASVKVDVLAGTVQDADLRLASLSRPKPRPVGMNGWGNPTAWTSQGAWQVRRGAKENQGFVPFSVTPVAGTFTFTARVLRGKRLRWAVAHTGVGDYLLFELDRKRFYRKQVIAGKARELLKTGHPLNNPEHYTISIDVAPHNLTHRLLVDRKWVVLDTWERKDTDFTRGRFGLIIRSGSEFGLSNFSFVPR